MRETTERIEGVPEEASLVYEAIRVSIVVPVYQGESTLADLIKEIEPLTHGQRTPGGKVLRVTEVILVNDGAVDGSSEVMKLLAAQWDFVSSIWLSRNFGQHPATLAGMACSTGEWVVTMDEDGQHDPAYLAFMLDQAETSGAQLVYARPVNSPPHAWWRNASSHVVNRLARWLVGNPQKGDFSSFRLVRGDIARSLAAYCGQGVFLDVALAWVVGLVAFCPVHLRMERGRPSGYSMQRLISHFWRLLLTAGTRPLRVITVLGSVSILAALGISGYAIWAKLAHHIPIQGWTSLITAICLFSGLILFSLGVIAEYLSMTLTLAMGKPLYLIVPRQEARRDKSAQ